jgi:hypothetical protein
VPLPLKRNILDKVVSITFVIAVHHNLRFRGMREDYDERIRP